MGRLRQEKVQEILKLRKKGYTIVEISEKVGVHHTTISRWLRKYEKKEKEPRTPPPSTLEVFGHSFLDLLATLQVAPYLDGDDQEDLYDDLAYKFLDALSQRDKGLAVKLLQKNQYITALRSAGILDLKKPEGELSESERKKRQSWLRLLKKNPEVLKQLV